MHGVQSSTLGHITNHTVFGEYLPPQTGRSGAGGKGEASQR